MNRRQNSNPTQELITALEQPDLNLDTIENLLLQGADPNAIVTSGPLFSVANETIVQALCHIKNINKIAALKLLLNTNKVKFDHFNENGDRPLHSAIWAGNVQAVELLLVAGADIHAQTQKEKFPTLIVALKACKPEAAQIIRLLRQHGATLPPNTHLEDYYASNALTWGDRAPQSTDYAHAFNALFQKQDGCPDLLEPNALFARNRPDFGATLSLFTCQGRAFAELCVPVLLAVGADPNQPGHKGMTALHCATGSKYSDVVIPAMVKYNLNLKAQNEQQQTPLHCALAAGNFSAFWQLLNKAYTSLNAQELNELFSIQDKDGQTIPQLAQNHLIALPDKQPVSSFHLLTHLILGTENEKYRCAIKLISSHFNPTLTKGLLFAACVGVILGIALIGYAASVFITGGQSLALLPFLPQLLSALTITLTSLALTLGIGVTAASAYGVVDQGRTLHTLQKAQAIIAADEAAATPQPTKA